MKFLHDVPQRKVLKAPGALRFEVVRTGNHIALVRSNPDGTMTPLTISNHPKLKDLTPRCICTQAGIPRQELLGVYEQSRGSRIQGNGGRSNSKPGMSGRSRG